MYSDRWFQLGEEMIRILLSANKPTVPAGPAGAAWASVGDAPRGSSPPKPLRTVLHFRKGNAWLHLRKCTALLHLRKCTLLLHLRICNTVQSGPRLAW